MNNRTSPAGPSNYGNTSFYSCCVASDHQDSTFSSLLTSTYTSLVTFQGFEDSLTDQISPDHDKEPSNMIDSYRQPELRVISSHYDPRIPGIPVQYCSETMDIPYDSADRASTEHFECFSNPDVNRTGNLENEQEYEERDSNFDQT